MKNDDFYTVGQVAALARVTVRTLHHYDRIGLLSPSRRSESGYRLYDYDELERLRQIRLLRELRFSLEAIERGRPGPDRTGGRDENGCHPDVRRAGGVRPRPGTRTR